VSRSPEEAPPGVLSSGVAKAGFVWLYACRRRKEYSQAENRRGRLTVDHLSRLEAQSVQPTARPLEIVLDLAAGSSKLGRARPGSAILAGRPPVPGSNYKKAMTYIICYRIGFPYVLLRLKHKRFDPSGRYDTNAGQEKPRRTRTERPGRPDWKISSWHLNCSEDVV
jgi:hypothetical protein